MTPASVSIRGIYAWSFTLLFVALKLTGNIDWNWLLVLSPAIARFLAIQAFGLFITYRSRNYSEVQADPEPKRHTGFYA